MNARAHVRRRLFTILLTAGLSGAGAATASAQTWDGGGSSNNWTDPLNWQANVPPVNNGTANLAFGGSVRLSPSANVAFDVNSLAFLAGSGSFNISGSPVTIRAGISNGAVTAQTISAPVVVGGAQTWSSGNALLTVSGPVSLGIGAITLHAGSLGPMVISGPMSGPNGIIKQGAGTLTIGAGPGVPNIYQGVTQINEGTLRSASANALPNGSECVLAGGAALDLNGHDDVIGGLSGDPGSAVELGDAILVIDQTELSRSFRGVISGTGGLTKSGTPNSELSLGGHNTYTGPTRIESGAVRLLVGDCLSDSSDLVLSRGRLNMQNVVETVNEVVLQDVPLNVITGSGRLVASSFTLAQGDVSVSLGGDASLTKLGAGELFLQDLCDYTGLTHVVLGNLRLVHNARLPFDGDVTVDLGGTLTFESSVPSIIDSLNGTGVVGLVDTTLTIGSAMGNGFFQGVIHDFGGSSLTKVGDGDFRLDGVADIGGTISILDGRFILGPDANLGDRATVIVGNHSVLDLTTGGELVGTVLLGGGDIRVADPAHPPALIAQQFSMFSGNVHARLDGPGAVTKSTEGTVRVFAPASYTGGTTIAGGTYVIQGDEMLGAPESDLTLSRGRLQVHGSTTLDRRVSIGSSFAIETFGHVTAPNIAPGGNPEKIGPGSLITPGNVELDHYTITEGISVVPASGRFEVRQLLRTGVGGTLRVDDGYVRLSGSTPLVNEGRLELSGSPIIDADIVNVGVLTGSGRLAGTLENTGGGSVRVGGGESLYFSHTGPHSNSALIDVTGGALEFAGPLTSTGPDSLIFGRAATLRFNAGLTNVGAMALSFGPSDVYGDVTNSPGGQIVLSGFAQATFIDDVANQGTIETAAGAAAVFLGSVSGAGSFPGLGTVFMEGDLRPGNSPAVVEFGGDLVLGLFSGTRIELAGTAPGEADAIIVGGDASIDGDLVVTFIDGFAPTRPFVHAAVVAGDNGDGGRRLGEFYSVSLPPNVRGMHVRYTSDRVEIVNCPGDFNSNSVIDSQDFFDFVTAFFALDPVSDFTRDGFINSQDFFDFLAAFFDGCP